MADLTCYSIIAYTHDTNLDVSVFRKLFLDIPAMPSSVRDRWNGCVPMWHSSESLDTNAHDTYVTQEW